MIYTIGGLPVFKAVIEDQADGMKRMSLVSSPAVEYGFLKFGKERTPVRLSVADEEKRLIYGPLMRANFPIYRNDPRLGEFFIVYSPETIREMAEKYIAEGRANIFNLQHQDGSEVEGVQMVQYFIKDTARGIAPAEFPDIEDGSLFGEFRVSNDDVWQGIKDGQFRGFSLEGMFGLEPAEGILSTEKVADDIKQYLNEKNMSKMDKIKSALARLVAPVRMGSITTDKGVLYWDGDGELEVGANVYQENEDGERVTAADGQYAIEGDILILVADGKVTDIIEAEAPGGAPAGEGEAAGGEGDSNEEAAEEDPAGDPDPEGDPDERDPEADHERRIAALERELADVRDRMAALEAKLAEYGKTPAGQPAHEAAKAQSKGKGGLETAINLARNR